MLDLDRFEQFSSIVSGIYRYIQKIEKEEMEKYGCKGAFAQYLLVMRRYPEGITSAKLGESCNMDKAAVSRIVYEMEEKGLAIRSSDNVRLYNAKITLTDEGKKAADFVCKRACDAVNAVGTEMSDSERKAFYNTLDFISDKLQRLSIEGIPQE